MEVGVVGTGYVGLVTGTCLAYLGRSVVCVDIDERKIQALREGRSPIYEPGLQSLIASGQQRGVLRFSTDLEASVRESEIIFIAVGTPPLPSGRANLAAVEAVARSIGRVLDWERRRVIVNNSTVPIGSGNWVEMLVKEGLSGTRPTRSGSRSPPGPRARPRPPAAAPGLQARGPLPGGLQPRVPARGLGDRGLPRARPGRHR